MARKTKLKDEGVLVPSLLEAQQSVASEQKIETPDTVFTQEGELVVDVFETGQHFVVSAAIAGVQIKDLDISVEKEMMIIKGNRPDPNKSQEKKYFYQECYWGPFSRKIILPENIHTDKASAQMDKGMLVIKIPKKETEETKTEIKTV